MQPNLLQWMAENWIALASLGIGAGSLLIAAFALVYAARALNFSRQAADADRAAELTALRLAAKESLAEARRSFTAVQVRCQETRQAWKKHNAGQPVMLGSVTHDRSGLFPFEDHGNVGEVRSKAQGLFQSLEKRFSNIECMGPNELEKAAHEIKLQAIRIEGLVSGLEQPLNRN